MVRTLHWHRRDLRVSDNPALVEGDPPLLGVFIVDPAVMHHAGPPRAAYLCDVLAALRDRYRERGGELVVRRGDPAEELLTLVAETGASCVTVAADYSGLARERDSRVRTALESNGIGNIAVDGELCHAPGEITTAAGETYQVFTYFGRKWVERPKADPAPPPSDSALADPALDPGALPTISSLEMTPPSATLPAAGQTAAMDRLETFCESDIYRYETQRDRPAAQCTSRLSQDLHFGTIGIRTVWTETARAREVAPDTDAASSVESFQRQLAWREFYAHVLAAHPSVVSENFTAFQHPIAWRHDPEGFEAWTNGETGFPIVDAGMRQLREEAFMHNRVRMIVASFLTKDLLIDWRAGYQWFREQLVDHDTANNTGGWQWAASTGTDAQPYFRVFNPMTQGERHDPAGEYISRYVGELADVSAETIHAWDTIDEERRQSEAPGYPAPIVDHATRREAAIAMFESARGE